MTDEQPNSLQPRFPLFWMGEIDASNLYGFDVQDDEEKIIASTLFSLVDAVAAEEWGVKAGALKTLCDNAIMDGAKFENLFDFAVQQDSFRSLGDFDRSLRNSRGFRFAPHDIFLLATASWDRNRIDDQFFALVVAKADGDKFPLVLAQRKQGGFDVRYNPDDMVHLYDPFVFGSPAVRGKHPYIKYLPQV